MTVTRKKPFNMILLLGAATVLVATIVAPWETRRSTTTFDASSNDPGDDGEIRGSEDAELRDLAATFMELGERLDDVNERIQLLADPMPGPDNSLSSVDQQHAAPASDKRDPENINTKSPWVVNLVSLSSKADADRFSASARSKDIQAEWYAVTVKGKQYWRVHVSGISTAAEAKSQANVIKEKLGLKDVWITQR